MRKKLKKVVIYNKPIIGGSLTYILLIFYLFSKVAAASFIISETGRL